MIGLLTRNAKSNIRISESAVEITELITRDWGRKIACNNLGADDQQSGFEETGERERTKKAPLKTPPSAACQEIASPQKDVLRVVRSVSTTHAHDMFRACPMIVMLIFTANLSPTPPKFAEVGPFVTSPWKI